MQSPFYKIIPVVILQVISMTSAAQSLRYHLAKADSLYQQKRYTQSLELYQSIFAQKQYTPAMFLKMAFIEEGLGHVAPALYYLNLYAIATRDDHVLAKITDVATKNGLSGYEVTDADRVLTNYYEHHQQISLALGALALFFVSLMTYLRSHEKKPAGVWTALLIVVVLLFLHTNFSWGTTSAIIAQPNSYMMNGPSAGASVVRILDDGHRVEVLGEKDVWVKIRFNNREGFIKKDNLYRLVL